MKAEDVKAQSVKAQPAKPAETAGGEDKPAESGGFLAETREFVKAIFWAFLIAVFLRSFVVEAYKIPSGSMLPTLSVGDHIFVNKFVYGLMVPGTTTKFFMWRTPERGEVIVFKFPDDENKDYIKRVVGVPGDVIDVRDDVVYVNGVGQPREFVEQIEVVDQGCYPQPADLYEETLDTGISHATIQMPNKASAFAPSPWKVPDGSLFVMGDNRDNSSDSRTGFFVPMDHVKGRAMFVWLSWDPCGEWWPFDKVRLERFGEGVR